MAWPNLKHTTTINTKTWTGRSSLGLQKRYSSRFMVIKSSPFWAHSIGTKNTCVCSTLLSHQMFIVQFNPEQYYAIMKQLQLSRLLERIWKLKHICALLERILAIQYTGLNYELNHVHNDKSKSGIKMKKPLGHAWCIDITITICEKLEVQRGHPIASTPYHWQ